MYDGTTFHVNATADNVFSPDTIVATDKDLIHIHYQGPSKHALSFSHFGQPCTTRVGLGGEIDVVSGNAVSIIIKSRSGLNILFILQNLANHIYIYISSVPS